MVVTNRLFHIISISFLVVGVILSAVGITLIIVSSATQCTPTTVTVPSPECPTPSPSDCPETPGCSATCNSRMFGAQVSLGDTFPWLPDLTNSSSTNYKQYADRVSKMITDSLEKAPPSGKLMLLATSDVSYDVQVTRFIPDDKGDTIAYTSGVAMSTSPIDEIPTVEKIDESLQATLGETPGVDSVKVGEPSHDCPECSVATECPAPAECPTATPTACPDQDCSTCPPEIITTECPSLVCSTPIPSVCPNVTTTECPAVTECPTILPTDCPHQDCSSCPVITTQCPLTGPTDSPTTCPPKEECPVATECPTVMSTECPTATPTACPDQDCSSCPAVITTECPSPVHTTPAECPTVSTTECPTVIPTDCPTPECTECPSLTCPTTINPHDYSNVTATVCPTIIPTDFPPQDCSSCPPVTTECPVCTIPTSPSCPTLAECPTVSTTECPTAIPSDCPATECPACPTDIVSTECPSTSCPNSSTECPICPSTDSPSECLSTSAPDCPPQTCHSTMFGAQVSLVENPWDPQLGNTNSAAFKALADSTSEKIINALESSSGWAILASTDSTVTYDVRVSQFIPDDKGATIALTSGVALSTGPVNELPSVSDIQTKMDANLPEDSARVEDNELLFCPLLPSLPLTTPSSTGSTQQTESTTAGHQSTSTGESQSTTPQSTSQEPATTNYPTSPVPQSTTEEVQNTQSTTPEPQTTTEETTQSTPAIHQSTTQENVKSSTPVPPSTSLEPETTQFTTEVSHSTTEENPNSSTPVPQSTSLEPETTQSTPVSQSTSLEPETTQSTTDVPHSTTQENPQSSSPVPQSTSLEPDTTQSTPVSQSTSFEPETTQSTLITQSTSLEPDATQSTTEVPYSSTEENHKSSTPVPQSTSLEPDTTQSTPVPQSTSFEPETTQSTPLPQSSSIEPETTQSTHSIPQSTTEESNTTEGSSPTTLGQSTTEESGISSTTQEEQSTTPESTGSTPSTESQSTASTAQTEADVSTTVASDVSTTEGPSISSTPSVDSSTVLPVTTPPSHTTTEQQTTVLTTEAPTTLPTTTEAIPSTVACSGREVIKGDVYLLFDYTLYEGTDTETMAIESFITDTLFSFDGNDFYFDRDPSNGATPLRFFLLHYPNPSNTYDQFLITPLSSLELIKNTIGVINLTPPTATESNMTDALTAIYATNPVNAPSIILISKSAEFVDEAIDIATQLKLDKKFNIIGVPLNGVDLTPLTNHADVPLDVTSKDAQVQAATQMDSILMSISSYCLTSVPAVTTSRYTTPSTTKTTTTPSSCASSLDDQSIAFVYQANGDAPTLNSGIVSELLARPEITGTGSSSWGALFPFPSSTSTAAHNWVTLNDPRLSIFISAIIPPDTATGANIAEGLQSLLDYPGPNHQIVVIIANSDDDVSEAIDLADQLKTSSTIITLSYGGDFDLSPLASSDQFALTQSTVDPTQAATSLLNSILQSTCQQ